MGKAPHVFKVNQMTSVDRGPGLRGWPLVTAAIGSEHLTTGITEFQSGASLALHTHNCEELVTILEGSATAEINGERYELKAPDTTFIPPGIPHRFINRSGEAMKIIWIYSSTQVTRTFVESGKTEAYLKK